eukprot:463817_1
MKQIENEIGFCANFMQTKLNKNTTEKIDIFFRNTNIFKCNKPIYLGTFEKNKFRIPVKLRVHFTELMLNEININKQIHVTKWDESTNKGGIFQMKCTSTLFVSEDGIISASNAGYSSGYGIGQGMRCMDRYIGGSYGEKGSGDQAGKIYGDQKLKILHFGSPSGYVQSRGGGIIELIAETIINNGQITSNGYCGGSGGSIKIRCKTFINKGLIRAKGGGFYHNMATGGSGRICIECSEYKNEGKIYPSPCIQYIEYKGTAQFTAVSNEKGTLGITDSVETKSNDTSWTTVYLDELNQYDLFDVGDFNTDKLNHDSLMDYITKAKTFKQIGNHYYTVNDIDTAIYNYKQALDAINEIDSSDFDSIVNRLKIALNNDICLIMLQKKEYQTALEYALNALSIDEQNIKALGRRYKAALGLSKSKLVNNELNTE